MGKIIDFELRKRVKESLKQLDSYFVCMDCGCDAFRVSPDFYIQCKDCGDFLLDREPPEGA